MTENLSDGRDPITGQFLPGSSHNPKGRPRGIDLRALAERHAFVEDVSLEDALMAILDTMIEKARGGDVKAAALVFERLAMPESRDPLVNLQLAQVVQATESANAGPPIPPAGEFVDWVRDVNKVAAQQGMLGAVTPGEIEAEAIAAVEDDEEDDYEDE